MRSVEALLRPLPVMIADLSAPLCAAPHPSLLVILSALEMGSHQAPAPRGPAASQGSFSSILLHLQRCTASTASPFT